MNCTRRSHTLEVDTPSYKINPIGFVLTSGSYYICSL